MFIHNPKSEHVINFPAEASDCLLAHVSQPENRDLSGLLPDVVEELMGGILILSDQRDLLYANKIARSILRRLNHDKRRSNLVPKEIWLVCQTLMRSRSLFPHQYWLMEADILTEDALALHIRARWINLANFADACLLIIMEDKYQAIKNIAVDQAQKYGLTPREQDVWLLHREHYTYKQMAAELCITCNTVKKHMRSIYSKQRTVDSQIDL